MTDLSQGISPPRGEPVLASFLGDDPSKLRPRSTRALERKAVYSSGSNTPSLRSYALKLSRAQPNHVHAASCNC
jgi:hypothetical protein